MQDVSTNGFFGYLFFAGDSWNILRLTASIGADHPVEVMIIMISCHKHALSILRLADDLALSPWTLGLET